MLYNDWATNKFDDIDIVSRLDTIREHDRRTPANRNNEKNAQRDANTARWLL